MPRHRIRRQRSRAARAQALRARHRGQQQFIDGDHAYILWNAETADNIYDLGTDTFVVRDGKIVAQSFTARIRPKVVKAPRIHPACA